MGSDKIQHGRQTFRQHTLLEATNRPKERLESTLISIMNSNKTFLSLPRRRRILRFLPTGFCKFIVASLTINFLCCSLSDFLLLRQVKLFKLTVIIDAVIFQNNKGHSLNGTTVVCNRHAYKLIFTLNLLCFGLSLVTTS